MNSLALVAPAPEYFQPIAHKRNFFSRLQILPQHSLLALKALTPPNWSVEFIDERVDLFDPDKVEAPLVGITTMTYMAPRAFEIARQLKARNKTVALGGYFPTLTPDVALANPSVDSVVVGRAELSWPKLLADFSCGQLKPVYNHPFIQNNFTLPPVNNSLLGANKGYNSVISQVQASLGCKFNCRFCTIPHFHDNQYVMRNMDDIVNEVTIAPTKKVLFVDDNLFNNPSYLNDLCDRLKSLDKEWVAQVSMDIAKQKKLIQKMARSGCIWLNTGIETIHEKTIKAQNKWQNNINRYIETIKCIKDEGINISVGIILGFPEEPPDVFDLTEEFIHKANMDIIKFHIYCPYPGTPEFEYYKQQGDIITEDLQFYDTYHVIVRPKNFTPEKLAENYYRLEKNFFQPNQIFKRSIKNLSQFGLPCFARSLLTGTMGSINIWKGIPTQP